ncbi:MAG: hypothetical protein E3J54_04430 [Actinobacteria bacterium]|nr:MAG: hypothetical protein E3J54_04430 [Actinomycetota bacterium]
MAEQIRYMNIPPRNIRRRRLLVLIPVIVLFITLYVIGYRATAARREAKSFVNSTNAIAKQSNYLGKQFRAALNSSSSGKFLSDSLNNLIDESLTLSQDAEAIEPPKDFKLAHMYFVVSMKLRYQGLEKYSRPIISSVSSSTAKNDKNIKEALDDISLSDNAHRYFLEETKRYLNSKNLKFSLLKSTFMTSNIKKRQTPKVETKKSPLGDADIFIDDVATVPLRIGINSQNEVRVLPDSEKVGVKVKVGNKGKVVEKDIPVEITLKNEGKFVAKKKGVLDSVEPEKTSNKIIKGFEPPKKGLNVFEIVVGPLFSEKNKDDNNYTYKFVFESHDTAGSNSSD